MGRVLSCLHPGAGLWWQLLSLPPWLVVRLLFFGFSYVLPNSWSHQVLDRFIFLVLWTALTNHCVRGGQGAGSTFRCFITGFKCARLIPSSLPHPGQQHFQDTFCLLQQHWVMTGDTLPCNSFNGSNQNHFTELCENQMGNFPVCICLLLWYPSLKVLKYFHGVAKWLWLASSTASELQPHVCPWSEKLCFCFLHKQ